MKKLLLFFASLPLWAGLQAQSTSNSVTVEAESGTLGSNFTIGTSGTIIYATCGTDLVVGGNPGNANRVATYTVTFPAAGTYKLYARVRVGPAGANDDSYFYASSFGVKTLSATAGTAADNDWIIANNLNNVGDTAANVIVAGGGSIATNSVWKWIGMSDFNGGEPPVSFTVTAGNLTQTFQIGGRENGLDIDKFVFGLNNYYFTVNNLNNNQPGGTTPPPAPYTPTGPVIALGKPKFLGCAYSTPQKVNFGKYWNQVTPENGGKWGTAEPTRGVFNWTELDSAYKLAKDSGYPFKMHTLIWGSQQPTWVETLPADTQLAEIKIWFQAVAARYPAIDFIEVVNEPLHAPPDATHSGKYINALGGAGTSGYDWILNSYRLARQYFPATTKLWLNDYSIINSTASTNTYLQIINLLKAENLIDGVGEQGHAFTTAGTLVSTLTTNLNTLASANLPLYITELDIDGQPAETPQGDTVQLNEYMRVFPALWTHPAVKGITVWGYRPGHWRTAQGAPLAYSNGAEKAALVWLRQYVQSTPLPVTLTAFEANKSASKVKLTWFSTIELNNDRYVIERSADGKNFATVLTVKAAATPGSYTAYDDQPLQGLNYYRLVQYDKDGRKTDYGIRIVKFGVSKDTYVQVYPNPAANYFIIRTEPDAANKGIISITDAFGRMVKQLPLTTSGVQTITTESLASGTYFVRVVANDATTTSKVIVKK